MKNALLLSALTFVGYIVLTVNYRAIAHLQYPAIALTAALAALIGYASTKVVANDKGGWGVVGAMVGGACADTLGTYLTRMWG